ncbi:MAG: T9SS type A sorting domain-containing protein [Candidatus Marinimicrobia bacterium]|nr:T9SS type A sorting domain-containing protein [Candidatus Neomarinimicrobiota bacterium]
MIKRIALLLFIGLAWGQNSPIDFETGGYGATWTWTVFENGDNPSLEIVTNPNTGGINSSATVAKFTALQTGQPWAGCESLHGSDIGTFSLDATNSTVKIMVYKTVISDVGLKFVIPSSGSLGEIKVSNTVTNEWEELTFDFSSHIGLPEAIGIDQIVVFPDFDLGGRTQDNVIYFDNISFYSNSVGVDNRSETFPQGFVLEQNFPNPFNPSTTLRYELPEDGLVNVTIYDMMGRQVSTLVSNHQTAGYKSIQWNATNDFGKPVSAGVYLYQIQAGEFVQTKKMVLLK